MFFRFVAICLLALPVFSASPELSNLELVQSLVSQAQKMHEGKDIESSLEAQQKASEACTSEELQKALKYTVCIATVMSGYSAEELQKMGSNLMTPIVEKCGELEAKISTDCRNSLNSLAQDKKGDL